VAEPGDNPETDDGFEHIWSRRSFFSAAGWISLTGVLGAWIVGFARFLYPRVLFEPTTTFSAGWPTEYRRGEVSVRFAAEQRVWIVREDDGSFYALRAVCTHLRCTPVWQARENKFKCPCHGSGYRRSGENFEGPAPRALERVHIELDEDGQLVVNTAIRFRRERGEWARIGARVRGSERG
jgi:cytochrome b6-f complex iron-sulfur subunit